MAIKFSQEEILFLKAYIPKHIHRETLLEHNNRFPDNPMTISQLRAFCKNHKVKSASDGRFKKGQPAYNKGLTWDEYMPKESQKRSLKTCFKKGHKSINKRPVGSMRLTRDGYWEIKIEEPNKWILMNRYVWERHNGPIPPEHLVIFLDGNHNNYDISNLGLISRDESMRLNKLNMRTEYAEITESYINLIRLEKTYKEKKTNED